MALEFTLLRDAQAGPTVTIDRHLYLTEDRDRVVEEGDPAGRFLWANPGSEMPRDEAEKLGAIKASSDEDVDGDSVTDDDRKAKSQPANKMRTSPGDKADDQPDVEALRDVARGLDIKVDGRWSVDRLQQEIDKASKKD
jgi:hypothetical protein